MEPLATVMARARGEQANVERPERFNVEGSDDDSCRLSPMDMLARGCEGLAKVERLDSRFFAFCRGEIPAGADDDLLDHLLSDTASSRTVRTRDRKAGLCSDDMSPGIVSASSFFLPKPSSARHSSGFVLESSHSWAVPISPCSLSSAAPPVSSRVSLLCNSCVSSAASFTGESCPGMVGRPRFLPSSSPLPSAPGPSVLLARDFSGVDLSHASLSATASPPPLSAALKARRALAWPSALLCASTRLWT